LVFLGALLVPRRHRNAKKMLKQAVWNHFGPTIWVQLRYFLRFFANFTIF
jgi:hypothetical protein